MFGAVSLQGHFLLTQCLPWGLSHMFRAWTFKGICALPETCENSIDSVLHFPWFKFYSNWKILFPVRALGLWLFLWFENDFCHLFLIQMILLHIQDWEPQQCRGKSPRGQYVVASKCMHFRKLFLQHNYQQLSSLNSVPEIWVWWIWFWPNRLISPSLILGKNILNQH